MSRSMEPGFARARQAFLEHAAAQLGVDGTQLTISPIEEAEAVQLDQRVGRAWAFYGTVTARPERAARGWAVADGTVITTRQNLGLLLREAGVFAPSPTLSPAAIADRIAWALGDGHRVIGSPELERDRRNAGTLEFVVGYRPPGPGGAGGGPERRSQCKVRITTKGSARLSLTRLTSPAVPFE